MAEASFTGSDGIVFTFASGEVENIECVITANPDYDSMPGMTPEAALLLDVNGVTKVIELQGELFNNGVNRLSGTGAGTVTTIDAQRQWLEAHLNGMQEGLTFASNYSSTWNGSTFINSKVLFASFRYREMRGNPEILPFQIILFVGDV